MIKITGSGGVSGSSDIKKKKQIGGAGNFGALLKSEIAGDVAESQETSATSAIAQANPFLALQQVSSEEAGRQQTIKYGNDLLNSLENLRDQMLIGSCVSQEELKRIEQKVRQRDKNAFHDPHLNSIIDEIETRVAVELAKLEAEAA